MTSFDAQPTLTGETLVLSPLRAEDCPGLQAAAASPDLWAGHPAKDRWKPEVFLPYFDFLLASGTTLCVRDRATGRIIGCSRYYPAPDRPDSMSIGFTFLAQDYWGGSANFEMKRLMLDHAFGSFPEVWLHIAPTNIRSQKATAKLGAVHSHDAMLALTAAPATLTMCFRLSREGWARRLGARHAPQGGTGH